jgi:hypothetical protein
MNKMTKTQREALIWKLMNAFPASLTSITAGVIDAYVEATWDCSETAILRSIDQYRSGRVEEHKGPFAPDAGSFAGNVRMWVKALAVLEGASTREKLVSYPMGALPPPAAVPLGPIKIDFGDGMIDMTGMSAAEKAVIMESKGQKRLGQSDADPRPVPLPAMRRM